MADDRDEPPRYTRYRARPRLGTRREDELGRQGEAPRQPGRPAGSAPTGALGIPASGAPGRRGAMAALGDAQAHRARAGRARRRLDRAVAGAVPGQLALRAHVAAGERRERAQPGRLSADLGQQHPRARLRPAPEGQQGTGGGNHRLRALGHDHADPHRRRARGATVDPARHRRRNPRTRPAEDQRRPRVRRAGGVGVGDQALARHPDQPRGRSQLRKLPAADRRDGRRHLHGRLHHLQARRRLGRRRLHAAAERRHPPHRRQAGARAGAHAREPVRARTRRTSSARNTSRRCSPT